MNIDKQIECGFPPAYEIPKDDGIARLEQQLTAMVALLSNYDLFSVQCNGAKAFYATQIMFRKDRFLEFGKLFAKPQYTDGKVLRCGWIAENSFTVYTKYSTYIISSLHHKPEKLPVSEQEEWKEIADLMQTKFFGSRLNKILTDESAALLVVDPYLIGELTPLADYQIARIINVYLNGKRLSLQIPRTVYFRVPYHCAENVIYAGIYDLAVQKPVTEKLIYNESMKDQIDPAVLGKYQSLFYAASVAAYGKSV